MSSVFETNGSPAHAESLGRPALSLGLLELCHVPADRTDQQVVFEAFEYAVAAEELGFSRFWLGEHHGGETAHACPEMMVGLIGQLTERIRVGTACVLLNYYSPLKVAKNFRLLHSLFPGRVDLGVGAGRVSPAVAEALLPGHAEAPELPYGQRVADLVQWLQAPQLPVAPRCGGAPQLWLLGSSAAGSAHLAAQHGASFSHALFLQHSRQDDAAIRLYRDGFQPGDWLDEPQWNVAVAGVCAETEAEAMRICRRHDNPFIVPTVVGNPRQCRDKLAELQDRYATDEIIFLDISQEHASRIRSCRLLSEALQLQPWDAEPGVSIVDSLLADTVPGAAADANLGAIS